LVQIDPEINAPYIAACPPIKGWIPLAKFVRIGLINRRRLFIVEVCWGLRR